MSRGQRFTFLGIAALIAVIAVFVLADSSEDASTDGEQTAATATPAPEATAAPEEASPQATPEPTPEPPPLIRSGKVTRLEFTEGERIRFRVRSQVDEEIHVHGYDEYVDVPAGETVNVSFRADITGIFEIELHGTGEQIAELRVQPD